MEIFFLVEFRREKKTFQKKIPQFFWKQIFLVFAFHDEKFAFVAAEMGSRFKASSSYWCCIAELASELERAQKNFEPESGSIFQGQALPKTSLGANFQFGER